MAPHRGAVAGRREQLLNTEHHLRRVVLLAGPSGSGKSRVARLAGCPTLNLDDFYHDAETPDLPRTLGIVDWDDPATWNGDAAVRAIRQLLETGEAEVPRYDISRSAAVGTHRLVLGDSECFIAEGIFAIEAAGHCRDAGIRADLLYLDRPRGLVMILRFIRDVREHRKSLSVLIRRGLALTRAEPRLRRRALAAGFRPVTVDQALAVIR